MAAVTLTIKNDSSSELVFPTASAPIRVAAGQTAELSAAELAGDAFAEALSEEKVSFVIPQDPTTDQINLARSSLDPLVRAFDTRLRSAEEQFELARQSLRHQQEAYNQLWEVGCRNFSTLSHTTGGWSALEQAVTGLVLQHRAENPEVAKKRQQVEGLEAQIKTLDQEDLAASHRSREEWFSDRHARQLELDAATKELLEAKLKVDQADSLADTLKTLRQRVPVVQARTRDEAIGQSIPPIRP